jgi:hypothetical protein
MITIHGSLIFQSIAVYNNAVSFRNALSPFIKASKAARTAGRVGSANTRIAYISCGLFIQNHRQMHYDGMLLNRMVLAKL